MNYIIIIILIIINFLRVSITPKKANNELIDSVKKDELNTLYKYLYKLNIGVIIINIITVIISIVFGISDVIAHVIFLVILVLSFILVNTKIENVKPKYNIISKKDKYMTNIISSIIYNICLIDRVGAIERNELGDYLSLLGIVLFFYSIVQIIRFIRANKAICKYSAKEEDKVNDIRETKVIELKNIASYSIAGIVIIIIIFVMPFIISIIGSILITILLLVMYNSDTSKIKKSKKELYNNITTINQMPGTLYAYQFNRHIENTKCLMIYIILFVFSILSRHLIGERLEFLILAMNIYTLVIYTILKNKKTLIEFIYILNEHLINKDNYKINIKNELTEIYDYKELLLNINFYKILYLDPNNNIYVSDRVLYNTKGINNDINLYINTTDMEDYIVVEEEYY